MQQKVEATKVSNWTLNAISVNCNRAARTLAEQLISAEIFVALGKKSSGQNMISNIQLQIDAPDHYDFPVVVDGGILYTFV